MLPSPAPNSLAPHPNPCRQPLPPTQWPWVVYEFQTCQHIYCGFSPTSADYIPELVKTTSPDPFRVYHAYWNQRKWSILAVGFASALLLDSYQRRYLLLVLVALSDFFVLQG